MKQEDDSCAKERKSVKERERAVIVLRRRRLSRATAISVQGDGERSSRNTPEKRRPADRGRVVRGPLPRPPGDGERRQLSFGTTSKHTRLMIKRDQKTSTLHTHLVLIFRIWNFGLLE